MWVFFSFLSFYYFFHHLNYSFVLIIPYVDKARCLRSRAVRVRRLSFGGLAGHADCSRIREGEYELPTRTVVYFRESLFTADVINRLLNQNQRLRSLGSSVCAPENV